MGDVPEMGVAEIGAAEMRDVPEMGVAEMRDVPETGVSERSY